ncbi:MAG: D-tyrosyl-tRNA(Tyr) deacylase [Candidatus Omnitrophica bacterium]|nr:D-tyrosyl-tRNA(Tyr) deacylase [Candidatus Omnitrophota bacterium]
MRALIQRVKKANVSIGGGLISEIDKGLLIFIGVGKDDREEDIARLSKKVANLRIFEDGQKKMNLDIKETLGEILSVPQFTLYADTRKGNRSGFEFAAEPEKAKKYWHKFNSFLKAEGVEVKEGVFGAYMDVSLVNDGPVTIMLDTKI